MFRRTGYRFAVKNMRHSTNSATAAEAAGAAVSQVFLAVRAGGRRNGRGRGKGQSKGQNELRHSPMGSRVVWRWAACPTAGFSVSGVIRVRRQGAPSTWPDI